MIDARDITIGASGAVTTGGTGTDDDPYEGLQEFTDNLGDDAAFTLQPKVYAVDGTWRLPQSHLRIYGNGAKIKIVSDTGAYSLTDQLTSQTHKVGVLFAEPTPGFEEYFFEEKTNLHVSDLIIDANGIADRGVMFANHLYAAVRGVEIRNAVIWAFVTRRFLTSVVADCSSTPWDQSLITTRPVNGFLFGEAHPSNADNFVTTCHMNNIRAYDHKGTALRVDQSFGNVFAGGHCSTNNQCFYLTANAFENVFRGTDFETNLPGHPGAPPANTAHPDISGPTASFVYGDRNTFVNSNAILNEITFRGSDSAFMYGTVNTVNWDCNGLDLTGTRIFTALNRLSNGIRLVHTRFQLPWGVLPFMHHYAPAGAGFFRQRFTSDLPGMEFAPSDALSSPSVPYEGTSTLDAAKTAIMSVEAASARQVFTDSGDYDWAVGCPTGKKLRLGERAGSSRAMVDAAQFYMRLPTAEPANGTIPDGWSVMWKNGSVITLKNNTGGVFTNAPLGTLA